MKFAQGLGGDWDADARAEGRLPGGATAVALWLAACGALAACVSPVTRTHEGVEAESPFPEVPVPSLARAAGTPGAPPWGAAVQAYLLQDALRVHVDARTGARVFNRPGMRMVFNGGSVAFTAPGVRVEEVVAVLEGAPEASDKGRWAVRYRLAGLSGDAGEMALGSAKAHDDHGTTMKLERAGLVTEVYENGREGLEQRFVIHSGMPGTVVLHTEVEGPVELRLMPSGGLSVLHGDEEVLRATAPRAWDAMGHELPAMFVPSPGRLDIEVRGAAAFPVHIDPVWTSSGDDEPGAGFGASVDGAGDVNGDGLDDVIIGAPGYDTANMNAGKAYLFPGTLTGLAAAPLWASSGDDSFEARFGLAVATAGDVNGDGYDDILVGSEFDAFGLFAFEDHGKAYLYLGSSSGPSPFPAWSRSGDEFLRSYGFALSSAGDVNADGYDDIIVGSPGTGELVDQPGTAYLYLGSPTGPGISEDWSASGDGVAVSWFGRAVSCAGDVDGDGLDDVVVGAPYQSTANAFAGKAYVYLGTPAGLAAAPAWVSSGDDQADARFGRSVSGGGDVDGDGYDDVVVGAPFHSTSMPMAGRAYLYPGGPGGLGVVPTWTSSGDDQQDALFAGSTAMAGDLNFDGFSDLLVGARSFDTAQLDAGRSYVFLGSSSGLMLSPSWTSSGDDQAGAWFGSVAGAGDVDGDGFDDIVLGAASFDTLSSTNAGKAYVYLGADAPSGLCDPAGVPCEDGDACTIGDTCDASGACVAGAPISCDDGNACTVDSCDPTMGCVFTDNTAPCDDGDACTVGDVCSGGSCTGAPTDCDDGDPCTTDSCDPVAGCQNVGTCDDAGTDGGPAGTDGGTGGTDASAGSDSTVPGSDSGSGGSDAADGMSVRGGCSCGLVAGSSRSPLAACFALLVGLALLTVTRRRP